MCKTIEQQGWKARRSRWKVVLKVMDVNKLGLQVCRALTAAAASGSRSGSAPGSGRLLKRDFGMF